MSVSQDVTLTINKISLKIYNKAKGEKSGLSPNGHIMLYSYKLILYM